MGAPQADSVGRMKRVQVPAKESGGHAGKMQLEETTGKDIKPEPMIAGPCGQMPQSQTLSWMSRGAMAFSVMVFLFESASYNIVFIGRILPAADKVWLAIPCAVLFNAVWGLAFWSYVQAHWSDAGGVPDSWHNFVRDSGDSVAVVAPRVAPPGWQPGKATHCKKCAASRPERSHHCQVCQRCVLRYDHHCPWINNCVGFCNHKFFLLLAIYGCLTSFVFCTTTIPQIAFCIAALSNPAGAGRVRLDVGDLVMFIISNLLSIAVGCLLALLLSIHLPLAMRNLTTVEDYYENMPNPFDQGGAAENLAQIFGVYGPDWLIPIKPLRPLSDGICFPRSEDSRGPDGLPEDIRGRSEREKYTLWRLRYHQMPPPGREVQPEPSNPLESLTRWWNSATSWQSNNETQQSLLVV